METRVAKYGTDSPLVTDVTYLQGSKRTKKVFEVAYVRMIYPHSSPTIQIDSKQKELQNKQEESSVHTECGLPLDILVGFKCCASKEGTMWGLFTEIV